MIPCVLTIAGLDPSGGAGLPADARTCAAFGAHALPVATAVIAQNTRGVVAVEAVSPALLAAQLDNILEDIAPRAVKIGMIPSAEAVKIIAERIKHLNVPVIIDPVFAPSSGAAFADEETVAALCKFLFPLAELVTPNWPEAEKLIGTQFSASELPRALAKKFAVGAVLLKGGHAPDSDEARDVLWDGAQLHEFHAPRIHGYEVRGTGCMLASAIAAQRAHGIAMIEAVQNAKIWLTTQFQNAQPIGQGRRVAVDFQQHNFQPRMNTDKHG